MFLIGASYSKVRTLEVEEIKDLRGLGRLETPLLLSV